MKTLFNKAVITALSLTFLLLAVVGHPADARKIRSKASNPISSHSKPALVKTNAVKFEQLSGIYADLSSYEYGKGVYGKRTFSFNHGTWTLHFVLSLDPAQKAVVFEYRCIGTYKLLDPSTTVANAHNAVFYTDRKMVKLVTQDQELAKAFGFVSCGLTPGQEQDISITGCAAWRPVAVCREDHDLLALDNQGGLYFGTRPRDNDMCSADKRPASLTPPVTKIK